VPEVRVISPEEELARKAEEALQQIAKRAAKRRAIAEEMVSTERSYVQGLQTLIAVCVSYFTLLSLSLSFVG